MEKKELKLECYLEWIFKIGLMIYSLLSFNSLSYGKSIISLVLWPIVICGGVLLILKIRYWREWIRTPSIILLSLFVCSYLISMIVNFKYGYKEGIIKLFFLLFYFFILFAKRENSMGIIKKEINVLGGIVSVYMFVCVIISFLFMILGYTKVETIENGWDIGIGFLWGRLWGIFTEPNYASLFAIVVILLSIFFWKQTDNKVLKILLLINDILQLLYISFTDSRTGRVALGVGTAIFIFNYLNYIRLNSINGKKIKLSIVIIVSVVSFAFAGMAPKWITKVYNYTRIVNHEEGKAVDRGYDLSEDVSNRRFDIWCSGLEVWSTTPIVGTSYTNVLSYTQENCPDTYMINNSAKKNFSSIHNEVLNILVGQGVVGISVFLLFFVWVASRYIKYFFKSRDNVLLNNVIISSMAVATAGAMFLTGMFYSNSPVAILFWIFLGDFMVQVETRIKEK